METTSTGAENQENESSEESGQENKEDEKDPLGLLQDQLATLTDTVGTLATTVKGIVDGTITAKLPKEYEQKFQEIDEMKLEASKSKVGAMIDAKIQAGYITPAMKEGILEAGLSMSEDGFKKLLAGYTKKLWDPKTHAGNNPEDKSGGDNVLYIDDLRKSRENNRY